MITKDTRIADAIRICPDAVDIFARHGLGCCGCMCASAETIEEGALMHELDVQAIVDDLNAACKAEND